jgi:hypothetical protein
MEQHDYDKSRTLFEIHAERSQNCHRLCKTLSQVKHFVLQSTAPLQLTRFIVGSKMAIAESAPVLPNQKNRVAKSPDSLTHPVLLSCATSVTDTNWHINWDIVYLSCCNFCFRVKTKKFQNIVESMEIHMNTKNFMTKHINSSLVILM